MNSNLQYWRRRLYLFVACLFFILALQSCGIFDRITYYDTTTFKNLTELKPEVGMLYESFTQSSLDSLWLRSVRLKLRQMYEYEKGKGEKNTETIEQMKIITEMFERHVADRSGKGIWANAHMMNNV
jgi:hypothetical protein